MEDDDILYEDFEIDPATGLPLAKVTTTSGSGGSTTQTQGYSDTVTQSQSNNWGQSEKAARTDPDLLEHNMQYAQFLDPRDYMVAPQADDEERKKTFADVMRRAEEQRQRKAKTYLNEGDRLRKKGRYLAWMDFLQSLGQIAGQGYAPVEKMDNSRTLKTFDDLDKMRLAAETIPNDDSLNWIEKLMLQDQIKKSATAASAAAQNAKAKQAIDTYNAKAYNDIVKRSSIEQKSYEGGKETNASSSTEYGNESSRSQWMRRRAGTYVSPEYLNASAMAKANKPFTFIGADKNFDVPLLQAEAEEIRAATYAALVNDNLKPDSNGYYHFPVGDTGQEFTVKKDKWDAEKDAIGNLMYEINANNATLEAKTNALGHLVQAMDAMSDRTITKHYRKNGHFMRGNAAPVRGANNGGSAARATGNQGGANGAANDPAVAAGF